jgi:ABC-type amino acid transport substrate-binding protein
MIRRIFLLAFFSLLIAGSLGYAQEGEPLRVSVKPAPPFVATSEEGVIQGFSVDLIREVAARLDPPRTVTFHMDPDIPSHLDTVARGEADLGIAATTITTERERRLDFSMPYFEADVAILVPGRLSKWAILTGFFTSLDFFLIVGGLGFFMFMAANLIWFAERGKNFSEKYWPGIFEGLWWTIVTITTVGYGDLYPRNPAGRLIAAMVIVTGILLFGLATASLTSMLTVEQLQSGINSPDDLVRHTVAVVEGTHTVTLLKERGLGNRHLQPVPTLEAGLALLERGEVDGLVHDRPLLQYLILGKRPRSFYILPEGFAPSYYGILFPPGSPLREPVNVALLETMEGGRQGFYYPLRERWFGE